MSEKARITLRSVDESLQEILRKMESFQIVTRGDLDKMVAVVARIPEIESRLLDLQADIKAVRARLDNLEGLYQHLDKRWEVLYHEYVSMTAALKRLEERFDKVEADNLRERVRVLEERLSVLEKNTVN